MVLALTGDILPLPPAFATTEEEKMNVINWLYK